MSESGNTFPCPRCGERLPQGFTRCDACGAYIAGAATPGDGDGGSGGGVGGGRARGKGASGGSAMPAWSFLVIGLVVGAAVGYALRSAVTPREEGGAPRGPADIMAGAGNGGGMGGGDMGGAPDGGPSAGMGGAGGMDKTQMMPQVVEALSKYRNALAEDSTNVEANIGIGNLMFDAGKWDKAIAHYSTALKKDPKNADVRVDRAIAYHSLGDNARALAELKAVTRDNPSHTNAWLNLGVVAATMGDTKTTISAWEKYLVLEPGGKHADAIRSELAKLR